MLRHVRHTSTTVAPLSQTKACRERKFPVLLSPRRGTSRGVSVAAQLELKFAVFEFHSTTYAAMQRTIRVSGRRGPIPTLWEGRRVLRRRLNAIPTRPFAHPRIRGRYDCLRSLVLVQDVLSLSSAISPHHGVIDDAVIARGPPAFCNFPSPIRLVHRRTPSGAISRDPSRLTPPLVLRAGATAQ